MVEKIEMRISGIRKISKKRLRLPNFPHFLIQAKAISQNISGRETFFGDSWRAYIKNVLNSILFTLQICQYKCYQPQKRKEKRRGRCN